MLRQSFGHRQSHQVSKRRQVSAYVIDGAVSLLPYLWVNKAAGVDPEGDTQARRIRYAAELLTFAIEVQAEQGRSPGFRLLQLNAIDAQTGSEVGLAIALARAAIARGPRYLATAIVARSKLRRRGDEQLRRLQELKPKIEALEAEHAANDDALSVAKMALYKREGIVPFGSCGPILAEAALSLILGLAAQRLGNSLIGKPLVVEAREH